jgi:mannose/fructose/N-acetylgalactosamine-specific phosphotransferase system component IID
MVFVDRIGHRPNFILCIDMKTQQMKYIDLVNIFLRCMVIQASWNFKALIGMGFCFCMIPMARRICDTPEERSEFLRRHLEYFNAHPYFASYGLGAVVHLEEETIEHGMDSSQISLFKERMAGLLGALGDELFWSRTKPVAIALAMSLALTLGWVAIPVFLIVYNVPHFYIRLKGWTTGYKLGFGIINELSMSRFQTTMDKISLIGLMLAGLLLPLSAWWAKSQDKSYATLAAFILSGALVFLLIKLKLPVKFVILSSIGVGIITGLIFSL